MAQLARKRKKDDTNKAQAERDAAQQVEQSVSLTKVRGRLHLN